MAEFCLDCWNRINGTTDDGSKYILSEELDLCEGCGEWRSIIVGERKESIWQKLRDYCTFKSMT